MQYLIFNSWQSDRTETKRYINKHLNAIAKKLEIKIESDARNSTGAESLSNAIFSKIDKCHLFIADISLINNRSDDKRKTCNPNVLIELGYAIRVLGWPNIILLFDEDSGRVEDVPFDIRQNKILKFNSKNENDKLKEVLETSIIKISEKFNSTIYDYLFSEIDNRILCHYLSFEKIFYFGEGIKSKHDYTYFLKVSKEKLLEDIEHSEFLGFNLFNDLSIYVDDLEKFINQKSNNFYLNDDINKKVANLVLSMRAINKFLNYESMFVKRYELNKDYHIIPAKHLNPNNEDSLVLLRRIDNGNSVVISANKVVGNRFADLKNVYKCNNSSYFVELIESYKHAILEWSDFANDNLLKSLKDIK